MSERILLRKRGFGLVAADEAAEHALGKLRGDAFYAEIAQARNPRQHALYWALMGKLFEHQDLYATRDQYSNAIKCSVGWCDTIPLKDGTLMAIPKSISFANMPQSEFEEFFKKVIELVTTKIWPHLTDAELREELDGMIGGKS